MTTLTPADRDLARFNAAIRQLYQGGSNNTGKVTLRASQTTTVVNHESIQPNSHISIMPLTASALAAMISVAVPLVALVPKIIPLTRVLSVASGSVSYTGVGFRPSLVSFIGAVQGPFIGFATLGGYDDGTNHWCGFGLSGGAAGQVFASNIRSIITGDDAAGANYQDGHITSMDADGFTIAWVKNGTPTATATFMAACSPPAVTDSVTTNGVRVSSRTTGSFTLTHPSNAAVDQNFSYSVTGGS